MTTAPPDLLALARQLAQSEGLDPALVCALIEQESDWDPWAVRYEPNFYEVYVLPLFRDRKITRTEATERAISWGLMQVMGQTARENGYTLRYLSQLCDPRDGIAVGCTVLKGKLDRAGGDVTKGLLFWNGGGNPNYPGEVLARVAHYAPPPSAAVEKQEA